MFSLAQQNEFQVFQSKLGTAIRSQHSQTQPSESKEIQTELPRSAEVGSQFNHHDMQPKHSTHYRPSKLESFLKHSLQLVDLLFGNIVVDKSQTENVRLELLDASLTGLQFLDSAQGPTKKLVTVHEKERKCFISVWRADRLHENPMKSCLIRSELSAFHAGKNEIIVGTKAGNLVVWDLHQQEHHHIMVGKMAFQQHSFSTARMLENNHQDSILQIQIKEETRDRFASFELYSLDSSGAILIWQVIRLRNIRSSETDLGMTPGGCIQIIFMKKIRVDSLCFDCTKSLLLGGSSSIFRYSKEPSFPPKYRTLLPSNGKCIAIKVHPTNKKLILAIFENGSFCVFDEHVGTASFEHNLTSQKLQLIDGMWLNEKKVAILSSRKLQIWDYNLSIEPQQEFEHYIKNPQYLTIKQCFVVVANKMCDVWHTVLGSVHESCN